MLLRPSLFGHRGARNISNIAENTFAAFDLALRSGCDGFEFDVRLSSDGFAVVVHDPIAASHEIGNAAAANLAGLSRLEDVLARYADRAFLDIELKVPGAGAAAVSAIHAHLPQRCLISSFLPNVLSEVRDHDDSIALGWITDDARKLQQWKGLPWEFVIVHRGLTSGDLIENVHSSGRKIFVWTVNSAAEMRELADAGVDGIISDDPELLSRTLRPRAEIPAR